MLRACKNSNILQNQKLYGCLRRNARYASVKVTDSKVLGIRREDLNVWERRAPIAPQHVKELTDKGITVLVQPSTRRAYTMDEYESAGAVISEDLSAASLIMAVKTVPIDILIPNKSYSFFSHTIKAQEGNMPTLDALLEKNIRLIDYEKMEDAKGKRVAAFGKFAGVGGMINILHGIGLRLLSLGHHTPFMYVGSTHNYKNSRQARLSIYELGEDIRAGKLPHHFGPLTFVFTGSGNVSQGAQEVFRELPHVWVHPHELEEAIKTYDHRTLVATKVSRKHYLVPKGGNGEFNAEEFDQHPERYRSIFAEKIAPFANVIVNGIYWGPKNPRLLTNADMTSLMKRTSHQDKYGGCPELPHRLLALCDITADLGGSLEFMNECTTIEYPFALYDHMRGKDEIGVEGDGLLYCSIDNIPAQLPREATDYFGKLLLPWIPEMVSGDATRPLEEETCYTDVIKGAIITSNHKLTPGYEYISKLRKRNEAAKMASQEESSNVVIKQRVLVLGAGLVSGPLVEYLTRDKSLKLTTVSSVHDEGLELAKKYAIEPITMDVAKSQDRLQKLVSENDLVISLLPYTMHPMVANMCIENKKNMLTASYVTPEMKELGEKAEAAGITIFQEIGLDPGIDHLLAMNCFDSVAESGGKVVGYKSYCGGLPAPEDAANPLRYKFSWSPRGALLTALNGARYLKDGEIVEIQPGSLMENTSAFEAYPGFNLEGYPNRDSTNYAEKYGLKDVKTMIRGTLRYKDFSDAVLAIHRLGFLDMSQKQGFEEGNSTTWGTLMNQLLGTNNLEGGNLEIIVNDIINNNSVALKAIKELGLLSSDIEVITKGSPLDTLSAYLASTLVYAPGERDLVLLNNQIEIEWADKKETREISLVAYGDPKGYSAMARTVSVPAAIAAKMILDGEISTKGTVVPLRREFYDPILKRLETEGISYTSKSKFSS